MWDAFVQTCQHALDTDAVPDSHGARPRLIITLPHQALVEGTKTGGKAAAPTLGETGEGMVLPPGVLRRLACDAQIIPAVLGSRSELLDVGRTSRTVTPALWTALVARDRHAPSPAARVSTGSAYRAGGRRRRLL